MLNINDEDFISVSAREDPGKFVTSQWILGWRKRKTSYFFLMSPNQYLHSDVRLAGEPDWNGPNSGFVILGHDHEEENAASLSSGSSSHTTRCRSRLLRPRSLPMGKQPDWGTRMCQLPTGHLCTDTRYRSPTLITLPFCAFQSGTKKDFSSFQCAKMARPRALMGREGGGRGGDGGGELEQQKA